MPASGPPSSISRCSNCGWELASGAKACPFCGTPAVKPRPANPLRRVLCPHCGSEGLNQPGEVTCTTCGRDMSKPPTAADKVVGHGVRAVRGIQFSIYKLLVLLLVAGALFGVYTGYKGYVIGVTSDGLRGLVKALEIFEGENGGYPGSLDDLARFSHIAIDPRAKADGWDRPIRYTVSDPYPQPSPETGLTLYKSCDLRSAGPNGRFDDEDDIAWKGQAVP
ncbi:MAG: zinc ribbon domain-containing protein [Acidobacteria bacterium]|nr:zinc ribbon domain-containing protein [Acidobacteriota bacterium]